MKKRAVAIVIISMLLFAVGVGSSAYAMGAFSISPSEVPVVVQKAPSPDIPQLTEEEKTEATKIMLADARFEELTAGKEYAIREIGVIHNQEMEKLGVCLDIGFNQPYQLEYDWPSIRYTDAQFNYQEETFHEALPVVSLLVQVDLKEAKVIAIIPSSKPVPSTNADEGR